MAAAPSLSADQDLSTHGFDIPIDGLVELLTFQHSARLDPAVKIQADWAPRLAKVTLWELEKSENRYAYAVDPLRRRQIIAIRGTANLMNALFNLELWKDKNPALGIKLHHGFE